MEVKFSVSTLVGLGIASFAGYFSYLILWIVWRRKTKVSLERMIFEVCITSAVVYFVYVIYKKYSEENVYMDFS